MLALSQHEDQRKQKPFYSDRTVAKPKFHRHEWVHLHYTSGARGFWWQLLVSMLTGLHHAPEGTTDVLRTVSLPVEPALNHRAGSLLCPHLDARSSSCSFHVFMSCAWTRSYAKFVANNYMVDLEP